MLILIIVSILLELYFVHKNVNLYRDKKINLSLFLLFLTMISALLIRNFIFLHHYLRMGTESSNLYSELMFLIISLVLVGLVVMMDIMHRPMLMADKEACKSLQDALESVPLTAIKNPYVIVNSDGKIVYDNEAYRVLVGATLHNSQGIPSLSDYFEIPDAIEGFLELDGQCFKLRAHNNGIDSLRFSCQSFDDTGHIFIVLDQPIVEMKSLEDMDVLNKKISRYDRLLNVGKWEMLYDTTEVICSSRTREIFGFEERRCSLQLVKQHIHPEDVLEFERILKKITWISASNALNIRFLINDEVKFVTIFYEMIKDDKGVPCKLVGYVQDLSTQYQMMNQRVLRESNDAIAGVIQEINDPIYPLLEDLRQLSLDDIYYSKIKESLYVLDTYKRKYIDSCSQKNLINADRIIEETISKFLYTGRTFNIKLNLNAGNSLIAIDEESFEKLLTHLIGDIPRINPQLNVIIASEEKNRGLGDNSNTLYAFVLKVSKLDLQTLEYEKFKERFYKTPRGNDETMLFHAQSIIKKFKGRVIFDEDEFFYIFKIEFDAIYLDVGQEKKLLRQIGYVGDYALYSRVVKNFFKNYSIDVVHVQSLRNVDVVKFEVVIIDASLSDMIIEGLATACRNTRFIVLNKNSQVNNGNVEINGGRDAFANIISYLSIHYVLVAKNRIKPFKAEYAELLDIIDKEGINASKSCKSIGGQALLYFEYLNIFKLYYQNAFEKLMHGSEDAIKNELKRLSHEADLLGCVDLVNYAEAFLVKKDVQESVITKKDFDKAMMPVNKVLGIIHASRHLEEENIKVMDGEVEEISALLEACREALRHNKPIHSRELIQILLHHQSLSTFEETLVEASLLTQKYRFDEAIKAIESVMDMVVSHEIA